MAEADRLLEVWAGMSPALDTQWAQLTPGPDLAAVAARLSSVPRPFLDEGVSIPALSGDILGRPVAASAHADDRRVRRGAAVALWLVASEAVVEPFDPPFATAGTALAVDALALRLAPVVDPLDWLSDEERREEAVRTFLLWCGHLPAGEDAATARSLLDARDSLRRNAALAEAYAEHSHRAEIARRLREARAREAAARYSSE
ncbi:phosphohydrolase [Microbacterium sp. M3]|uniref:Phosphohydrolase n=1 Tax=Microbacterium arthrosphaerae TaxID=792652 RepID=A0ABU4GXA7_9MICO|nr:MULTISPECIES: phosphohydrolase [Microbacterium]MDW4571701.1 phosphohydrolase [Microbacterium arthrosphaerae]MDW7605556.1 phosphohydrolase [Microbacterium sp. M3]